jgi:hypothetical protein
MEMIVEWSYGKVIVLEWRCFRVGIGNGIVVVY